MRFRKRSIEVEAIQWLGGPYECLDAFCGENWTRADARDMGYDDPEQVIVFNSEERQWVQLPVGHWIIRGLFGELYPCSDRAFRETYDQAA